MSILLTRAVSISHTYRGPVRAPRRPKSSLRESVGDLYEKAKGSPETEAAYPRGRIPAGGPFASYYDEVAMSRAFRRKICRDSRKSRFGRHLGLLGSRTAATSRSVPRECWKPSDVTRGKVIGYRLSGCGLSEIPKSSSAESGGVVRLRIESGASNGRDPSGRHVDPAHAVGVDLAHVQGPRPGPTSSRMDCPLVPRSRDGRHRSPPTGQCQREVPRLQPQGSAARAVLIASSGRSWVPSDSSEAPAPTFTNLES